MDCAKLNDARTKAARRAEIATRYERSKPKWSRHNQLRGELRKVFRRRLGMEVTKAALDAAIFDAVGDPLAWSPETLGQAIGLKFEEYKAFKPNLRTIRPCDATPAEIAIYQHEKKKLCQRLGARERRRRKREERAEKQAALNANHDLDVRKEALFSAIGTDPITVSEIVQKIGHWLCWRPLKGNSLKRVMRRELDHLKNEHRIDDRNDVGPRGRWVRLVWRAPDSRTAGQQLVTLAKEGP